MTYDKEPTITIKEHKDTAIGSKVMFSDFYLSNYCGLSAIKDQVAEVINIKKRTIPAAAAKQSKDMYQMYMNYYGVQATYDVVELQIKFANENKLYCVSPFGVKLKE